MCPIRLPRWEKPLPHSMHSNALGPVWVQMWVGRPLMVEKPLPHSVHVALPTPGATGTNGLLAPSAPPPTQSSFSTEHGQQCPKVRVIVIIRNCGPERCIWVRQENSGAVGDAAKITGWTCATRSPNPLAFACLRSEALPAQRVSVLCACACARSGCHFEQSPCRTPCT